MPFMTRVKNSSEDNVGKNLHDILEKENINGYVLILRTDTEVDDTEAFHMFTVDNNLDELSDMLMAASQYLPDQVSKD